MTVTPTKHGLRLSQFGVVISELRTSPGPIPAGRSVMAEVYPSLWMRRFPAEDRNVDQQAAYSVAARLRLADGNGSLERYFNPPLEAEERTLAQVEGWILGVD